MTPCKIDGCPTEAKKRGWCNMHYNRWVKVGDPGAADAHLIGGPHPIDIRTRYEVVPSGCWVWIGSRDRKGYGKFTSRGRTRLAHRHVYELHVGPIPEGLELDHLCRNPPCVNPEHLEPVTGQENMRRRYAATRKREASRID